ncbi:hypothetical protein AAEX63_03135 [Luteococcus sp. H138]|uniref:hypothetical protein n=1 Tax=unclassified Luteococcus TaxID=2639923 RepID=UPI00313E5821
MKRRQAATAVAVLAALSVGSVVDERLQDPNEVLERPYDHHAALGDEVAMRTGTVVVHGVDGAAKVRTFKTLASTPGVWLLVDVSFTAKDSTQSVAGGTVVAADGRRFGGKQAVMTSCGVSIPGVAHHCRQLFELPRGVLAGASFEVSTAGRGQADDVAVIDLGIDQAKATRLEASTSTFDADKEGA